MTVRADPAVPTKTQVMASSAETVVGVATESFRDRRMDRLAEGRRRRELLSAAAPSADPQFLNAIAAADRFWGRDELWRDALQSQHAGTTAAAGPTTEPVDAADDSNRRSGHRGDRPSQATTSGGCWRGFVLHVGGRLRNQRRTMPWTTSSTFRCRASRCAWWAGPGPGSPGWR